MRWGSGSRIIRAELVGRVEGWHWRSLREYSGPLREKATRHPTLPIDGMLLPPEGQSRI
jgi:hypothetical protein